MMTIYSVDGWVEFTGTISGNTLIPSPGSTWDLTQVGHILTDLDSDMKPDAGDYLFNTGDHTTYSGFTVSFTGNDYAVFFNGTTFYVPYMRSTGIEPAIFSGTAVTQTFTQSGDNVLVVNYCFVTGTLIATPTGERRVEDLQIGDLVTTADGRAVPVKWLGHQQVKPAAVNVALDDRLAPVCIRAGALGNHSDLYVSADHGMILSASGSEAVDDLNDGLVINASALVNHDTIRFVPASEMPVSFTYWHIETDAHDAILANGAASETFIDAAGRAAFDNHGEYLELYGVERIIPEMSAPRITTQRLLPKAVKARLVIGAEMPQMAQTA